MASGFDQPGAWTDSLPFVRNVVRQELVARQLADHLPSPSASIDVVDVGCGQATQVIRLARDGYSVVGIEPSAELLSQAYQAVSVEEPSTVDRVTLVQGRLEDLTTLLPQKADVIACHGVLMYLPDLQSAVAALAENLRSDGVLSLLTRNQASIAMRAGMQGSWDQVQDAFDARHYDNRLGITDVRADRPDEVLAACSSADLEPITWYGVRLFSDHFDDTLPGADLEQLIDAEEQAGRRDPYRHLAALTHVLARRG
ncbi:MAG: class I SAM-dependent methyltransferase [Euzebya sp.]